MGDLADEEVVAIEVGDAEDAEGGGPGEAVDLGGDHLIEPVGKAEAVEEGGHRDESSKPDKSVPSGLVGEDIFPVEDAAEEEDGEADKCSGSSFDPISGAEYPEDDEEEEDSEHDPFIAPHWAYLCKAGAC